MANQWARKLASLPLAGAIAAQALPPTTTTMKHDAVTRIRIRCALAATLLGMAAGLIHWKYGQPNFPWWTGCLVGMTLVLLLGAAGGLLGMFGRQLWSLVREGSGARRDMPVLAGILELGTLVGAFLGLLVVLIFLDWSRALWGAALGATLGSALATAFGETADVLLHMAAQDLSPRSGLDNDLPPDRQDRHSP